MKQRGLTYEQAIEDATVENAILASDPALLAEARAGMARLAVSLRGGKRPGSGRKPREARRTVVLLVLCRAGTFGRTRQNKR